MGLFENKEIKQRKTELNLRPDDPEAHFNLGAAYDKAGKIRKAVLEFEETIKSRNRDTFNYNNFSEGEKMRIDLALLFTWRNIAKLKNSVNTNILILDEIFDSSLDGQGTDDFFKILKSLQKENVFIISHKGDIMFDKFTNIIKFEKHQNFTRLA